MYRFNSYKQKEFQKNSKVVEVGISDHHHLVLTSMRS